MNPFSGRARITRGRISSSVFVGRGEGLFFFWPSLSAVGGGGGAGSRALRPCQAGH